MNTHADAYVSLLLQIAQTAVWVGLAVFCLTRLTEGTWAVLGLIGAALSGLYAVVYLAGQAEATLGDSVRIFGAIFDHHLNLVLSVVYTVGIVLVVSGFVTSRLRAGRA